MQTQSLLSILIGGIAFETPPSVLALPVSEPATVFTLYANRAQAFEPPAANPQTYRLIFNQSVRGLSRGAPVEFRGIRIGQVMDIAAEIDANAPVFGSSDNPVGPPATWRKVFRPAARAWIWSRCEGK